jgi:hypothetical protein
MFYSVKTRRIAMRWSEVCHNRGGGIDGAVVHLRVFEVSGIEFASYSQQLPIWISL